MFQVTHVQVFKGTQELIFTETREKHHTLWDIQFLCLCVEYMRT